MFKRSFRRRINEKGTLLKEKPTTELSKKKVKVSELKKN